MNLTQSEFIDIAKENACDPRATLDAILASNPTYTVNITQIASRIGNYRKQGLLPLDSGVQISLGEVLRGTTTTYDSSGNIKRQSVRTEVPKTTDHSAFYEAIGNLLEDLPPYEPKDPVDILPAMEDLLTLYPLGDPHIGLLAHAAETGADNDLTIAVDRYNSAMTTAVAQAMPTQTAIIVDTGDYFHADDASNTTPRGKNPLDVDGRYHKVLEKGLQLAANLIEIALTRHDQVHWRSSEGNHNPHSSVVISQFLKAYFRNEPRVTIHDSPKAFYYYQFGTCLFGFTHGHTCKPDKLGELMAVDCADIWSTTKHRYWLLGHVHHLSTKEYPSCLVETFRTLSGKDAWHTAMGYRSGQDLKVITYHKDHGEVSRQTLNLSLIP